jgi:virulence factor Mce-like protein
MVTQAPPRAAILVALVFILASIGLSLFVWNSLGGSMPMSPQGYRFGVSFENASQLQPNADVRIAGVSIGKVVDVEPDGLRTNATIEIDTRYAPVPSDTRAILRQKTLLGETFVVLTPGSRDAPKLAEDGTLAIANVEATQPLDRILGMFDERTRANLRTLFTGGAAALDGRAEDLNQALGEAGPVTGELEVLFRILDRQRASVRGLVRDTGTVLATVGEHRAGLAAVVDAGAAVASETAARAAGLAETTRALGPALESLESASAAVERTARIAGPVLAEARPVAPLVEPALAALRDLSPQVQAVLADLDEALPVAEEALPATARLIDALGPFVEVVHPATREITPIIAMVSAYRQELVGTMANVGSALQATAPSQDGRQVHYLRALIPFTEESIVGYSERLPSNRHNAYFAPGGLAELSQEGLLASDCRNTANEQIIPVVGSGPPPCRVQPGWTFDGRTAYFPHVERVEKGSTDG